VSSEQWQRHSPFFSALSAATATATQIKFFELSHCLSSFFESIAES
jgi:hypothetical protein